jgi:hypothetical protein
MPENIFYGLRIRTRNITSIKCGRNFFYSLILFTLMMEALRFSETSDPTRATRHHIPQDGILQDWRLIQDLYYMGSLTGGGEGISLLS